MDYVIKGIVSIDNLRSLSIIKFIDINKVIHLESNIISVSISYKDLVINKIDNKNINIYILSFIYILNINAYIGDNSEQFTISDVYSKTFTYKDIEVKDIELLPINLDVKILNSSVAFNISFIIVDGYYKPSLINDENHNIDSFEELEVNDSKNYSYINMEQEFI